jgi:hypothetical protein
MCRPRRLVEGSGRKGLAVVAQCTPGASFAHSRLPASRAGAVDPNRSDATDRFRATRYTKDYGKDAKCHYATGDDLPLPVKVSS